MKFFGIVSAALAIVPATLAAPILEERQTTPAAAISNSVAILQGSASSNEAAITSAILNARNNVNAAVQVAATVGANLGAILKGFQDATNAISASITQAGAGLQGQGQALAQAELNQLAADLVTVQNIINGLGATIFFSATNLGPTAQATVSAELTAVKNAVAPFTVPIMAFADAASKASAAAGAEVRGLNGAYTGLGTVVNRFAATNGLPAVTFPSVTLPGYASTQ